MIATSNPAWIANRPLEEWNAARERVESYFKSLRLEGRPLIGDLTSRVLDRAMLRAEGEPHRAAMAIAAEEMHRVVSEWFAAVLGDSAGIDDPSLAVRGRLALLLADMPGKWQEQFLKPGPWPEEFVRAMRESSLLSGPDLLRAHMNPRPLDLGPINALTKLGDLPYFRMMLAWLSFGVLLVVLFQITH